MATREEGSASASRVATRERRMKMGGLMRGVLFVSTVGRAAKMNGRGGRAVEGRAAGRGIVASKALEAGIGRESASRLAWASTSFRRKSTALSTNAASSRRLLEWLHGGILIHREISCFGTMLSRWQFRGEEAKRYMRPAIGVGISTSAARGQKSSRIAKLYSRRQKERAINIHGIGEKAVSSLRAYYMLG